MRHEFLIDTSGWSQGRQNYVIAAASRLLFDAGVTAHVIEQPFNGTNLFVVTDLTIPNGTISTQTILAKIQEFEATWEAERLAREALVNEAITELESNNITSVRLSTIDAWIDSQIDPIANLADAKTKMKFIFKKLVRYLIAREIKDGQR